MIQAIGVVLQRFLARRLPTSITPLIPYAEKKEKCPPFGGHVI